MHEAVCGCSVGTAFCEQGCQLFQRIRETYSIVYRDQQFLHLPSQIREARLQQYQDAVQGYVVHLGLIGSVSQ